MKLTSEELSLIHDIAFAAAMDCDIALDHYTDKNDNHTVQHILQSHSELFMEISKKAFQEIEDRKTNDE